MWREAAGFTVLNRRKTGHFRSRNRNNINPGITIGLWHF